MSYSPIRFASSC